MKRRDFLTGGLAGTLLTGALPGSASAKTKRRETRELIARAGQCSSAASGPFSFSYRGVGSMLWRATSPSTSVCVVIPTVAKRRKTNQAILELEEYRKEYGGVDHLVVCPLHSHWDHAWHLDHFRLLTKSSCPRPTLVTNEVVFHKSETKQRRRYDVSNYEHHVLRGCNPTPLVFDFGDQKVRLTFIEQGHAAHLGEGKGCSRDHRHCGVTLPVRHAGPTYAVLMELETVDANGDRRMLRLFANDAASGYIAGSLPDPAPKCDVALITAADAHLAFGYPHELIKKIRPDVIRWVHWEEFVFHPKHARKTSKLPWLAGQCVMPLGKVQDMQTLGGCFPRHGHHEEFAGHVIGSANPLAGAKAHSQHARP